jgi:hypothetical protein
LPFASIAATSLEKSFSNFNYSKTIEDYAKEENCFVLKCSTTFPEDFFFRFIVAIQKIQQEIFLNNDNNNNNNNNNNSNDFNFNISTLLLDFLPSNHCYFFPCINRSINGNIVAYLKFKNSLLLIPHSKILNKIVIFNVVNENDDDEIKNLFENICIGLIEKYYKKTFSVKIDYFKNNKNMDHDINKKEIQFSNKIETFFKNNNSDFFNKVFLNFFLMWSSSKFFQYSNVLDVFYEIVKNFLYDEADLSLFGINNNLNNNNQSEQFESELNNYFKKPLILEYNLFYNFDEEKFEKKFGDELVWREKKINWKELKNDFFDFFDDILNKNFQINGVIIIFFIFIFLFT